MTNAAPSFYIVDHLASLDDTVLDQFVDTHPDFGRMIFRDALQVPINGTGKRAIAVSNAPNAMYPGSEGAYGNAVTIRCYADHTRDTDGEAPVDDGVDRAWAMWGFIANLLKAADHISDNPLVQIHRTSNPLESFDPALSTPYVAINYDVAVLAPA